ncbi:MAG: DeoR family transcriptional regulator [[Clostridium] scindens]
MKERHAALLDYVMQNGKTEVNTLAELLQTSKVTVRKDLDYLSERGLLKRERGYAVPNDPSATSGYRRPCTMR